MRVIAGNQQLVRLDDEVSAPADAAEQAALLAAVEAALPGCAALVLSDYAKGVLTPAVVAAAIAAAKRLGLPVLVDPKSDDFALLSRRRLPDAEREGTRPRGAAGRRHRGRGRRRGPQGHGRRRPARPALHPRRRRA